MQNCVKAVIAIVLLYAQNCKWQHLYALLQLTVSICIIAIEHFCKHHGSWQCLYALFSFHIFCMYYWMCHLWYALCTFCNQELLHSTIEIDNLWISHKMLFMDYCKWHLVYALLLSQHFVCTVVHIDNFYIRYCK